MNAAWRKGSVTKRDIMIYSIASKTMFLCNCSIATVQVHDCAALLALHKLTYRFTQIKAEVISTTPLHREAVSGGLKAILLHKQEHQMAHRTVCWSGGVLTPCVQTGPVCVCVFVYLCVCVCEFVCVCCVHPLSLDMGLQASRTQGLVCIGYTPNLGRKSCPPTTNIFSLRRASFGDL